MADTYDSLDYFRRAIEFAPKKAPWSSPNGLIGWRTPAGIVLCFHHVSRMQARGCSIPRGSEALWSDKVYPDQVRDACPLCEDEANALADDAEGGDEDGVSGQDREGYTDDQDRDNYAVEED